MVRVSGLLVADHKWSATFTRRTAGAFVGGERILVFGS